MIVKFHARGRGGGAGPVDYLMGKDRQREGASVLQGKTEEVRELIDASPYAKKYTSGVLSFAEQDVPPGQREKLMASFERVLLPGLDKDQYSILWVEHADKGRLELNFVIPNTELLTGKRLQPYFDRADRPRIDAWQTVVNGRLGLHDPNAPENRRALVTPSALPKTKLEAAAAITRGLLALASSGELKTRQDVTEALETAGFDVVRTTKHSISLADPDGGRNIRLKGALYEQSFNTGEGLRAEIESAAAEYRRDAENRIQRARAVCKSGTERKRGDNQRRHSRPQPAAERCAGEPQRGHDGGDAVAPAERAAYGRPDVADPHDGVRSADGLQRERAVVAGEPNCGEPERHRASERHAVEAERENVGHRIPGGDERSFSGAACGDRRRPGVEGGEAERGETGEGVMADERAGKTVAECVSAATAGLLATAGRVGERLRGIAGHVRTYLSGQSATDRASRTAERAGDQLEHAGAAIRGPVQAERAIATAHQQEAQRHRQQEYDRLQKEKTLELERTRSRDYPDLSL